MVNRLRYNSWNMSMQKLKKLAAILSGRTKNSVFVLPFFKSIGFVYVVDDSGDALVYRISYVNNLARYQS